MIPASIRSNAYVHNTPNDPNQMPKGGMEVFPLCVCVPLVGSYQTRLCRVNVVESRIERWSTFVGLERLMAFLRDFFLFQTLEVNKVKGVN